MSNTRAGPVGKERAFKGAVAGRERRKATVTGYSFSGEPLVEVRLFHDHRDQGQFIDLTLPQARQMVRLLLDAIESAAKAVSATTDRNASLTGREPAGAVLSHDPGH